MQALHQANVPDDVLSELGVTGIHLRDRQSLIEQSPFINSSTWLEGQFTREELGKEVMPVIHVGIIRRRG